MPAEEQLSPHQHILSVCANGPLSTLEALLSSTPTSSLPSTESMALAAITNQRPSILQHILNSASKPPTSHYRALTIAALKTGDLSLLDVLLSAKIITINHLIGYMGTPLLYATQLGHPLAYLSALFERGADPNIGTMGGGAWPGLAVATMCGNEDVVRLYLAHGATVPRSRALWEAAARGKLEIVKILVQEAKADVNEVPEEDNIDVLSPVVRERGVGTALHEAAREGHGEVVKFLLTSGARKDAKDTHGQVAQDVAISCNKLDVVKILQEF